MYIIMNKIFIFIVSFFAFIGIASYHEIDKNVKNDRSFSDLVLSNVEALANINETDTKEYWCCGNTGVCAEGPNYVLHGKFSETKCD